MVRERDRRSILHGCGGAREDGKAADRRRRRFHSLRDTNAHLASPWYVRRTNDALHPTCFVGVEGRMEGPGRATCDAVRWRRRKHASKEGRREGFSSATTKRNLGSSSATPASTCVVSYVDAKFTCRKRCIRNAVDGIETHSEVEKESLSI